MKSDHGDGVSIFKTMFDVIYGVDFSGAKLAGRNTWVAQIEPVLAKRKLSHYVLTDLWRLEDVCGTAERATALSYLVGVIKESRRVLWSLDFPFGLPLEVMEPGALWPVQLDLLHAWGEDAYGVGLECLRRAKALGGPNHIRRLTDSEEKAPFDPYHYRIIYQTFTACETCWGHCDAGSGPPSCRFNTGDSPPRSGFLSKPALHPP